MDKQKITCKFKDVRELYDAYMPFLKKGGLFVRTDKEFNLGDKVELEIFFFEGEHPKVINGKVIWLTFPDMQKFSPAGIGVQFEVEDCKDMNNLIHKYLAGFTNLESATYTM